MAEGSRHWRTDRDDDPGDVVAKDPREHRVGQLVDTHHHLNRREHPSVLEQVLPSSYKIQKLPFLQGLG